MGISVFNSAFATNRTQAALTFQAQIAMAAMGGESRRQVNAKGLLREVHAAEQGLEAGVRGLEPYNPSNRAWNRGWLRRESKSESFSIHSFCPIPEVIDSSRQSSAFSVCPRLA